MQLEPLTVDYNKRGNLCRTDKVAILYGTLQPKSSDSIQIYRTQYIVEDKCLLHNSGVVDIAALLMSTEASSSL